MASCPNGARPRPGQTAQTVLLTLGQALADVAAVGRLAWPGAVTNAAIGRLPLQTLCDLNPDDPGPPTAEDLAFSTLALVQFAAGDPAFGAGSWIYKQTLYHYFESSCECISPGETIPPRGIVPLPPNEQPYPTDPGDQQQWDRIEHNQGNSWAALQQLYQGLQVGITHTSDTWSWVTPNTTQPWDIYPVITMQGEGRHDFGWTTSNGKQYRDVAGLLLTIVQVPPTARARGTLNPRIYGVGSVYWDARHTTGDQLLTSRRESIHYMHQAVAAPRDWVTAGFSWYLQPGAIVQAQQIGRAQIAPSETWNQPIDDAFTNLNGLVVPDHIDDPPLWPRAPAARRLYAVPSPP